jgi:hypothetical protein
VKGKDVPLNLLYGKKIEKSVATRNLSGTEFRLDSPLGKAQLNQKGKRFPESITEGKVQQRDLDIMRLQ